MNKFAKTLCMMAVVVLAFTSCKKNNQDVKSIPFNASFEQFQVEESDFRAYINNNHKISFENGDQVMLFNIETDAANSQSATYEVSGTQLNLVGGTINPTTTGSYYAFYPAANVKSVDNLTVDNTAVFTLKDTQTYRTIAGAPVIPADALYTAAQDNTHKTLTETFFDMKNICGVLELNLYSASGKAIRSIRLTDKTFNLVGDVTLNIKEVDPNEMTTLFYNYEEPGYAEELAGYMTSVGYYTENTSMTVTLKIDESDYPDGVALSTDVNNPTKFYIVLRPLALRNGCTLQIVDTDGAVDNYDSSKPNIMKPNFIRITKPIKVG